MAELKVNRVTNANCYCNGVSLLGQIKSMDLPDVKQKMSEHAALGMIGTVEFAAGLEKMEAKIEWNSFYADILKTAGDPSKTVQLQIRSSVEGYNSSGRASQVPLVVFMTAQFKNFPLGNFKQHDNVELNSMLSVTAFRLEIDGVVITEIDVMANVYKVNGVDILETYRENLGI